MVFSKAEGMGEKGRPARAVLAMLGWLESFLSLFGTGSPTEAMGAAEADTDCDQGVNEGIEVDPRESLYSFLKGTVSARHC